MTREGSQRWRKPSWAKPSWAQAIRNLGIGSAALGLGTWCCLWVYSWGLSCPEELLVPPSTGSHIVDRDGRLLARTMADGQIFRSGTRLEDSGPYLPGALIAAEDARFRQHPGVDLISVLRALAQAVNHGSLISGASTITQQLARQTFDRPRTLAGKWEEMARALAIERRMNKDAILEAYLSRVHFGSNLVGAAAAADHYFGKPLAALDLSEAATLAGLVRGPSVFDPRRHPERAVRERNRVLGRMLDEGFISSEQEHRAREVPLTLLPRAPLPGAHHWVRVIQSKSQKALIQTTLDGLLQRKVEALVAEQVRHFGSAQAASVVVLDNSTGQVMAYVGSPNFADDGAGGQNDGVQALRQPGSTLKPLIYAMAMDELGWTPASLLPDAPQHFATASGYYSPRNYDRRFRGSVRLRRALANSLNVPAVFALDKLGVDRTLQLLKELGLHSLKASAEHYGPALALGDGEVTLLELTSSYAALARGGRPLEPRLLLEPARQVDPSESTRPVLSPTACALVLEILSDDAARREAFGSANALELPFPVAVKTGTSKGHRDSWTVGTTRELSVGVWVGNFDGRPTDHLSGAVGAGPLFHRVMKAAVDARERRGRTTGSPLHDVPLRPVIICVESGRPIEGEGCERTMVEWQPPDFQQEEEGQLVEAISGAPASEQLFAFPRPGMVFELDPAQPRNQQGLMIAARTEGPHELRIDGHPLSARWGGSTGALEWPLELGKHRLEACPAGSADRSGAACDAVEFTVTARRYAASSL